MPSTPPWNIGYNFADDDSAQNQINAQALQDQFIALSVYLAEQFTALGIAIRDDDTLTDQLVMLRNLHPEVSSYLLSKSVGSILTQALNWYYPCRAASTANVVTLVGLQTIDGVSLASGDRVLLKDQTDASQNGIWIVHAVGDPVPNAAGLWVRAADLPAGATSGSGWGVIVSAGTINASTAWMPVTGGTPLPVVGTDALTFMAVIGPLPVPISKGGTGAITALAARTALGASGKATAQITGDGATTSFTVSHSLATALLVVSVSDDATNTDCLVTVTKTSSTVTIAFATAPTNGVKYNIVMVG